MCLKKKNHDLQWNYFSLLFCNNIDDFPKSVSATNKYIWIGIFFFFLFSL